MPFQMYLISKPAFVHCALVQAWIYIGAYHCLFFQVSLNPHSKVRSIITSVLLFSILLPTLSPWGTIAYFNLNREYIAKVLCENRDKPKLNCNGKCYLAKILKQQQDKQNKETTERVQNLPVLQLFSNPLPAFEFISSSGPYYPLKNNFCYRLETYPSPSFGILRPPKGC
jgi:hypothetical protein